MPMSSHSYDSQKNPICVLPNDITFPICREVFRCHSLAIMQKFHLDVTIITNWTNYNEWLTQMVIAGYCNAQRVLLWFLDYLQQHGLINLSKLS
jgi:hypothetical protein